MKPKLSGVFPIVATPFTSEGEVDETSLVKLVRFLIDKNIDGLALFGNASEMYTLTEGERTLISECVTEEVDGKVPLVFGTSHTGLKPALEYSKQADRYGATALMILPPYMAKPDNQRMIEFFSAIAGEVSCDIMLQDAPIAAGISIPTGVIKKLIALHSNIKYVKVEAPPTTIKMEEIIQETEGQIAVFGGLNGMYYFEELLRGSSGIMPACEFPEPCVGIHQFFKNNDIIKARDIFYNILPLIRIGTTPRYAMSIHKTVLKIRNIIDDAHVRNPNADITDSLRRDLDHILEFVKL